MVIFFRGIICQLTAYECYLFWIAIRCLFWVLPHLKQNRCHTNTTHDTVVGVHHYCSTDMLWTLLTHCP